MDAAAEIVGLWITAEVAIGAVIVAVLLARVGHAKQQAEDERVTEGIKVLRAIPPAVDLANPLRVTPSPLIPTRQLATRRGGHPAGLDHKARRAAVITAAGPETREFNAIVERNTGRRPAGRGPREADVWQQDTLPIEVGA